METATKKRNVAEIVARLQDPQPRIIKYEWEEFVEKLSGLDDPVFRDFGLHELDAIRKAPRA